MGTQSFSYYSDGFLMQVFSQLKAQVQPPLHNKGSLGFSPPFYSLSFEKERERAREREKEGGGYKQGEYTSPACLLWRARESIAISFIYSTQKEILFNKLSSLGPWSCPSPVPGRALNSNNRQTRNGTALGFRGSLGVIKSQPRASSQHHGNKIWVYLLLSV